MKSNKLILAAALMTAFTTAQAAVNLKNDAQKVGYAIGVDMGQSVKELGGDDIDINAVIVGLQDAYQGNDLALTEEESAEVMQNFAETRMKELQEQFEQDKAKNAEAGAKFLEDNGKQTDVNTTESGLQYKVLTEGQGAKPTADDTVTVNYEGRLIDGTVFDSSYKRGEPVTFAVTDVIPGWVEGLQLMNEGSKYTFFIPSDLAYGENGAGPAIPPNSTLIFDVELLKIAPADAEKAEAPADAEKAEAPADAEKAEAPADAEKAEAPTDAEKVAPADAEKAEAPTDAEKAAPADAEKAAPADAEKAAPADAEKAEAPAK